MVRVLVVEDDPDIRDLVVHTLELQGYEVESADNGARGWARLNLGIFDLLVADWMMPALGGLDLVKACRDEPAFEHLPIIMLTSRSKRGDVRQGLAAGATAYVIKPFVPREFVQVVTDLLGRR